MSLEHQIHDETARNNHVVVSSVINIHMCSSINSIMVYYSVERVNHEAKLLLELTLYHLFGDTRLLIGIILMMFQDVSLAKTRTHIHVAVSGSLLPLGPLIPPRPHPTWA